MLRLKFYLLFNDSILFIINESRFSSESNVRFSILILLFLFLTVKLISSVVIISSARIVAASWPTSTAAPTEQRTYFIVQLPSLTKFRLPFLQ